MAAVRAAERSAHAEALFGEVQADAGVGADAVELAPDNVRGVDPALPNEILYQPAEVVLRQRCDHRSAFAPALAHGARNVVFAPALPHLEAACVAHSTETGIETQHDLTERRAVPLVSLAGRILRNSLMLHFPR